MRPHVDTQGPDMIQQIIIADTREELDRLHADQVIKASGIIVREPGRESWQVVKAKWSPDANGTVFANKTAALRAVMR